MRWTTQVGLAALVGLVSMGVALALQAAAPKTPPGCAAIKFRPVPSGLADGEQDAGLYKSRFGRIELKATVKTGEPQDYFIEVDGKRPATAASAPASLAACAESKKMPAPAAAANACTGEGFMVVVDHAGKERLFALYARQGRSWHFCRANSG